MKTEQDIWRAIKPKLKKHGMPVRIENAAAASVPDTYVICPIYTVFMELKVAKSDWLYIPRFQYAHAVEMTKIIDPWLFWILFLRDEHLLITSYRNIVPRIEPATHFNVKVNVTKIQSEYLDIEALFKTLKEKFR